MELSNKDASEAVRMECIKALWEIGNTFPNFPYMDREKFSGEERGEGKGLERGGKGEGQGRDRGGKGREGRRKGGGEM